MLEHMIKHKWRRHVLRKVSRRLQWTVVTNLLSVILLLSSVALPQAYSQLRKATQLTISPQTFTIVSGQNITLTAKLTSDGQPLAGKHIVFAASLGFVNPNIATTDENGIASTVYTASELSIRTNVTVTASFLGDITYEESTATSQGIIEVELPTVSISGASFAVPESLKGEVSSYRNAIPEDVLNLLPITLPSESFMLATPGDLYLVFADQSDKGLAYVDGWKLPLNISLAGVSMSVIVAKSVTFEKEGAQATISEILANPDNYVFKLVKISANRRQVSILYDPDEPPSIEFPVTVGYLVEKPVEPLDVLGMMLDRAGDFALKLDEQFIRSILKAEENECLWLFNFEYEYWYDAPTVTNGIIIPTDHPIFNLINQSMPGIGRFAGLDGKVVLYDVKTDIPYEEVSSVSELKANYTKYLGKIVGFTVNCYGGYISVQEVLRECADKDIPVDVRLEGLVSWNELNVPPKREELLLTAGVSSFHQDQPFVNVTGVFELIGKVVSTGHISDSLPEDVALVICWANKVGEIDFEKLAQQVKDEIKGSVGELYWALQDIYPYKTQPSIPYKVPEKVFSPKAPIFVETSTEIPEICVEKNFTINIAVAAPEAPIKLNITNSLISNITITLKETARNVTIFFEKLVEKPTDVPEPQGLVYAYHEISISIPEDAIKGANITFWVPKEWLATNNATAENVVMLRYHAGEWANLQTRVIGENATHFKFIAETPGFSTFAIIPEFAYTSIFTLLILTTIITTALWKTKRKRQIS
jgi:PGF-pre-PGF domain-containing protein